MRICLFLISVACLCSFSLADENGATKAADRVQAAAEVLNEIQAAPDKGIPQDVLRSAQCVGVVPSMLNGAFIIGAKYGKGLASCRTP